MINWLADENHAGIVVLALEAILLLGGGFLLGLMKCIRQEKADRDFVFHGTTFLAVETMKREGMTAGWFSRVPYAGRQAYIAIKVKDLPRLRAHDANIFIPDWFGLPPLSPIAPETLYLADKDGKVLARLI